jgi:dTDP-4-dehydrorhamnose reductase
MYYNLINNKHCFGKLISFGSGAELSYPTSYYGLSKRIIAESMSNLEYCLNLRIFAVFDEKELDRRFIKSNILRYIHEEDMVVHENKLMDFFYMKDLIALVDYHIEKEDWLYREVDCKYVNTCTLLEISQIINKLSKYKVGIGVANENGKPYTGVYRGLQIPTIGLEKGIQQVYYKLKTNN